MPFVHSGGLRMNSRHALVPLIAMSAMVFHGAAHAREQKFGPLTLQSQGSLFVGGEVKPAPASAAAGPGAAPGEITVNQMYVQYQIPPRAEKHAPVVMVHGCCLSSKTWETTPDGRM